MNSLSQNNCIKSKLILILFPLLCARKKHTPSCAHLAKFIKYSVVISNSYFVPLCCGFSCARAPINTFRFYANRLCDDEHANVRRIRRDDRQNVGRHSPSQSSASDYTLHSLHVDMGQHSGRHRRRRRRRHKMVYRYCRIACMRTCIRIIQLYHTGVCACETRSVVFCGTATNTLNDFPSHILHVSTQSICTHTHYNITFRLICASTFDL